MAGEEARTIEIVERDGNTVRLIGRGPKGSIEVICDLSWEDSTLVLRDLHADGFGPGSLGFAELRALARLFARQEGARTITIFGGIRTTGARPGKVPRPVVLRVED